jgi:hypothetical protein
MPNSTSVILAMPQAPSMVMPSAQWWFTVWLGVPLAIVIVIGLNHLRTGRGPLLLLCVIGGAIASGFEAIVNILGAMIYAEDGIWTAYESFNRHIPVLIPMAYAWFMGGQAYLCYRMFVKGVTRRRVFELWAAFAVIDAVIETPGLLAGVYTYFGAQPFDFWGFPFWYGWANALVPVVAGAAIFKLLPVFGGGWGQLAVIPLLPMANGLAYATTCWPILLTLNTDLGYWATYPASLLTLGLTLYVLWMVARIVVPDDAAAHVHEKFLGADSAHSQPR